MHPVSAPPSRASSSRRTKEETKVVSQRTGDDELGMPPSKKRGESKAKGESGRSLASVDHCGKSEEICEGRQKVTARGKGKPKNSSPSLALLSTTFLL